MPEITAADDLLPLISSDDAISTRLKEFVQDKEAFSANTWRQLLSVMRICFRWAADNARSFLPM